MRRSLSLESRGYDDRGPAVVTREYGALGFPLLLWPLVGSSALGPEEADWLIRGLIAIGFVVGVAVGIKHLWTPRAKVPLEVRGSVSFVEEPKFQLFEKYVHDKNHEFTTQLQHLELAAEERRLEAAEQSAALIKELRELGEKLDGKRSVSVANLHDQLKSAEKELASVKKEAEVHTQQLVSLDVKVTNVLREMPRRVGR